MKRFEWTKIMETEFKAVKNIFTHQIRLSPLDVDKKINIATDGANSPSIGFILYQNANDLEEGKDVKIIKANSSGLKDSQRQYSAIDTELLALKFACDSSYYYLYGASQIHVYTDCSGLERYLTNHWEFQVEESREMPVVWLIAQTLLYMWGVRANGKTVDLNTTRSVLEGISCSKKSYKFN